MLSVSQTRGVLRRTELTDKPARAETLDVYKVCRRGDLVFNKMSIRAGAVGVAGEDGLVTYHYEVMRPFSHADGRYLAYVMKSAWFIGELVKRERGIGAGDQANVRTTEVPFTVLRTVDAHLPSRSEQAGIANFLDRETARIDAVVAKQEHLIDVLRERRVAVVSNAVDCADGSVPLRRYLSRLRQGWSPNCEADAADGVTEWGVLKTGAPNRGVFSPQENKRLPDSEEPRPEAVVQQGEIVMSRASSREWVGSAAYVEGDYPRLMLSDLTYGLSLTADADPKYVVWALAGRRARGLIEAAAKGTSPSMQKLSQRDVRELTIWVPPLAEQRRIADHLAHQTTKIDALIKKAEELVEAVKERRAALITAAVTGQIDVRGEVA